MALKKTYVWFCEREKTEKGKRQRSARKSRDKDKEKRTHLGKWKESYP
jgi:hypothetical protein